MWHLNVQQQRSMKMMQTLQPKIKAIQDRYKSNPQMMQQKLMEFYKEHTREIAEAFASEYISSCDTLGEWCYVDTDDKTALNIRSSKDTSSS